MLVGWHPIVQGLTHWHLGDVIANSFKQIDILSTFNEIGLRWMPKNPIGDKSTLVQVMAWCCQATSHYLSQCWPRSVSSYDSTRPQWVNSLCIARSSATMVSTLDKWVFVFHKERFQLLAPNQCWETIQNANMILYFLKINSAFM